MGMITAVTDRNHQSEPGWNNGRHVSMTTETRRVHTILETVNGKPTVVYHFVDEKEAIDFRNFLIGRDVLTDPQVTAE